MHNYDYFVMFIIKMRLREHIYYCHYLPRHLRYADWGCFSRYPLYSQMWSDI